MVAGGAEAGKPVPPEVGAPVAVRAGVTIDPHEISYDWARSSGPGGQNVNKVNTRVTLLFSVEESQSLSLQQKALIRARLATRMNHAGVLRVAASRHRTQLANKRAALARFAELLADALHEDKPRKKSRTPAGVKRKRLADKTHRGRVKEGRRWQPGED